jgi:hypothetical protein
MQAQSQALDLLRQKFEETDLKIKQVSFIGKAMKLSYEVVSQRETFIEDAAQIQRLQETILFEYLACPHPGLFLAKST